MRARWLGLAAAFLVLAMQVLPVDARPKIVEKTEYYSISGKTGWDLFVQMNRRGPRHGFLTKASAVKNSEATDIS